jgi:hypothetical protein
VTNTIENKQHRKRLQARIKTLAEMKMFKNNYKQLASKIGAITAVSKNRERIKHTMQGGFVDIDNKQNKKIFESMMDECGVLKEKMKKYKDMPGKYDGVQPKYMDIKDDNAKQNNAIKIMMNGKNISDKNRDEISLHMTKMKQHLGEKRREVDMRKNQHRLSLTKLKNRRYTHE